MTLNFSDTFDNIFHKVNVLNLVSLIMNQQHAKYHRLKQIRPQHIVKDGHRFAPSEPATYVALEKRFKAEVGFEGVFAAQVIHKGQVIGRGGGQVLESIHDLPQDLRYATIIENGQFLAPGSFTDFEQEPLWFINHSCDPNTKRIGGLLIVAKRDIAADEELTVDYAPIVATYKNWEMECLCGSCNCRKLITAEDWQQPHIAAALWEEWLPYIQQRILALNSSNSLLLQNQCVC